MKTNKLIDKLEWAIENARNNKRDSISCGKIEEYIFDFKMEMGKLELEKIHNKKNGGKNAKDSVVDFVIDID